MSEPVPNPGSPWKAPGDARERLLVAAAEIFADKGYDQASTREICRVAGVNVASIHYYFGDKASLYREVFRLPQDVMRLPGELLDPAVPLRTALNAWYRHLLGLAQSNEEMNRIRLLFLREQIQPSGIVDSSRSELLKPYHEHMTAFLCRGLGIDRADSELHLLSCNLAGLAMVLLIERAAIQRLVPGLLDTTEQINRTADRLTDTAMILIDHERARRASERPKEQ